MDIGNMATLFAIVVVAGIAIYMMERYRQRQERQADDN